LRCCYNAADIALSDWEGNNVLHRAIGIRGFMQYPNITIVQLLLNNMKLEDINHLNRDGRTPLDFVYIYYFIFDNNYNEQQLKQQLIGLIRQKGGRRRLEIPGQLKNPRTDW
jgi:hypothetical protein